MVFVLLLEKGRSFKRALLASFESREPAKGRLDNHGHVSYIVASFFCTCWDSKRKCRHEQGSTCCGRSWQRVEHENMGERFYVLRKHAQQGSNILSCCTPCQPRLNKRIEHLILLQRRYPCKEQQAGWSSSSSSSPSPSFPISLSPSRGFDLL